jgi:hypothetical protein
MNSVCLFSSYFSSEKIPNYVKFYLKELSRHFTKVVFITNDKEIDDISLKFLAHNKIEPFFVINEGHDFGMWYKAMLKYDIEKYDRVALINDSCILFKPLDDYFKWLNSQKFDYAGMTDSEEIVYHIQSYFVIINKQAIKPTLEFFKQHGLQINRQDVINLYELGLCKHLEEMGLNAGAWFSYEKYMPKYNSSVYAAYKIIEDGFPLIKKKIIFNSFSTEEYKSIFGFKDKRGDRFKYNPKYYISAIKKANPKDTLFDFELLKADGYNPEFKRVLSLQLTAFQYRIKKAIRDKLKPTYRFLKIRYVRDILNYAIERIINSLVSYKEKDKEAKVAICLICKDENQYLKEWIDYHRDLGFNHFFIYDNNSRIPISKTIDKQPDCTVIVWKDDKLGKQNRAYFDCCQKNKQYDWILFIDTDEFLILKKHKTVQEFLGYYKSFLAVGLNWICYTSSGYENRVEWFKYHKHIPLTDQINQHIKSFVKPRYIKYPPPDPYKFSIVTVNEHKQLINGPLFKHSSDIAFIRHNITRSKTEYLDKINRGRGNGTPSLHTMETFSSFEKLAI